MNLLAIISVETLIAYLFGGSVPLIGVFLTMTGLDLFTGYAKALKSHTWISSINLYGLLTKFITFSTIICAAALDKIAPVVGITLPINVALIWTGLLIVYEIGSILENSHEFGLKSLGSRNGCESLNEMLGSSQIRMIRRIRSGKIIGHSRERMSSSF